MFEILLRLFSYPVYGFQKGVFVSDEIIGYKLSTNYSGDQIIFGKQFELNTNSKGLRDNKEYNYSKSKEAYRILILGDSFSFGNGVNLNESYPEYLRDNFKNKNVEIINLGVPGYGINNEYLYFIKEGIKYNPDLVIVQFCSNDWGTHKIIESNGIESIDTTNSLTANSKGFLIQSQDKGKLRSLHLTLLWNLRSYSFIYTKLRNVLSNIIDFLWKNQHGIPNYFSNNNSMQYLENNKGYSMIIKKLKDSTNAKILIFLGPFQLDNLDPNIIQKEYNLNYSINPKQTKQSVEEIAKQLDILSLSIYTNSTDIYLPVDGHWNAKGNKLVADELYKKIVENMN